MKTNKHVGSIQNQLTRRQALRDWMNQPLGQKLREQETAILESVLGNMFGYFLVMIDPVWLSGKLFSSSRVLNNFTQSLLPAEILPEVSIQASCEALPWQTDSVDSFVLPHTLELANDPYQLLREIDRCLIPEGNLVILGFNPISLWGIRHLFRRFSNTVPWSLPFMRLSRVKDWLSLLGYDFIRQEYYFPVLPGPSATSVASMRVLKKLHSSRWPLVSGCYLLVARKRLTTITPIKPPLATAAFAGIGRTC